MLISEIQVLYEHLIVTVDRMGDFLQYFKLFQSLAEMLTLLYVDGPPKWSVFSI